LTQQCTHSDNEAEWYNVLDEFVNYEGLITMSSEMISIQVDVNNGEWSTISACTNTTLLITLLLQWVVSLAEPLISNKVLSTLNDSKVNELDILKMLDKEEFETINLILELFRKIPSLSTTTLDFALERLAIYSTSHRESLTNFRKKAQPKQNPSIQQIMQQGDQMVDKIRSKVTDSIHSGMKTIPTTYLSSLPQLPQLPQLESIKQRLASGMNQIQKKQELSTSSTSVPPGTAPKTNTTLASGNSKGPSPNLPKEDEIPPLDGAISLLKKMYMSYRVSPDNRAILTDTSELAFKNEDVWKSPCEIIQENHQRSTSNLAHLLKPNSSPFSVLALAPNFANVTDAFNNYITKPIREATIKNQLSSPDLLAVSDVRQHLRSGSTPLPSIESRISITTTPRHSIFLDDQ
jgi:hypothetical protein